MKHPRPRSYRTDPKQIDVGRLRASVRISDVAALGTTLRFARGALRGTCPFHKEGTPSFVVDDASGHYVCHGCGARGDVLRLAQFLTGTSFLETCEWLMHQHTGRTPANQAAIAHARIAREEAVAKAKRQWRDARPVRGSPLESGLRSDGLFSAKVGCLRFDLTPGRPEIGEPTGQHRTLVVAFQDVDGRVVGVARHLQHVSEDYDFWTGERRMGQFSGATARFGPARSRIMLAASLDDAAWVLREHPGEAVWAVLEPQHLHDVALPHWVTHVTVCSHLVETARIARVAARVSLAVSCLTVDVQHPR